jgi:hypothetical protein
MSIITDTNAQDARIENNELRLAIADAEFLTVFLALGAEERGARWQMLDYGAKFRLVARQIEAKGYDWTTDLVEAQIAKYDAKWASDLPLPTADEILTIAKERSELAQLHSDYAGAAQLNRVRVNIKRGARLTWSMGDLLVQSVNNPGQVYSVNRAGCTCKNGAAGKSSCWHVCLFDLLLDLQQTEADTADMEADAAAEAAERAASAALGRRICEARSRYDWAA